MSLSFLSPSVEIPIARLRSGVDHTRSILIHMGMGGMGIF